MNARPMVARLGARASRPRSPEQGSGAERRQRGCRTPSGVAVLLLLALTGCGGKVPPTRHYTLEIPLSNPARAANTFPVTVAVVRFQAPRPLQQDRVVFRPAPNQVDFYEYHRWADSPPDLVTNNLVRHLKESNMFRSVVTTAGAPADYFLRGTIESLEEVDSADSVSARVALSAELLDSRTRQIVWSGRGSHDAPVQERSVEGIVKVLNEGLRQSIEQLSRSLALFFQRGAAAPGGAGVSPANLRKRQDAGGTPAPPGATGVALNPAGPATR